MMSVVTQKENEKDIPKREVWGSKAEFILSCVGLSVGIGNVWRFPHLAYENGGGAFLFPYVILLLFVGKPMYFLEVALGQYSNSGPTTVWKCFPLGKGIGVAMVMLSIIVAIYYNIVMSYTLLYMAQSFRSVIPWSSCFEWWGADSNCYVRSENTTRCADVMTMIETEYKESNRTEFNLNNLTNNIPEEYAMKLNTCTNATQTASEQFWERYVLDLSSGIEEIGPIKWDLALCVFISWTVVFLALKNGIKSSGKVVYFTATFPYVVLISLLIYGATLDGAIDGIYFFFVPKWEKLLDVQVWRKAAEQLFYSLSISWGGLTLYGSYNQFYNKVHRDALFISSLDFLTSLISGVVIFSVLGNMAKTMNLDVAVVVKGGPGLAFVAYPEALAQLWVPQLWSFLFFSMLFFLGVDSEFAYLETFLTAIYDEYPKMRNYKTAVTFFTCLACFFLGLPCVTRGGQYVFNLMDVYGGGFSVLLVSVCEAVALMWGYGFKRLCDDFEFMLGFRPGYFWQISWAFVSPVVLLSIFIMGLVSYKPITYNEEPYPLWADLIGWALALSSLLMIPIWAIVVLYQNRKDLRKALSPTEDWGPTDPEIRESRNKLIDMKNFENIDQKGIVNNGLYIKTEYM
ncbi:sodium- and chloride-dependent glycine transporter 2-like isoform X1 [Centruroides sculpturatus]|uniref:sodium- and chloride-dependent glycine transporter 2-like isoform X1 n=2 Tax=Centruroides sculpturatus TaxID=218467 RepID=UPI000C6EF856|nr:sodium- and chloride-dependent glycine transporter 2-like isoform X1 [Centruroides sculpturatus]